MVRKAALSRRKKLAVAVAALVAVSGAGAVYSGTASAAALQRVCYKHTDGKAFQTSHTYYAGNFYTFASGSTYHAVRTVTVTNEYNVHTSTTSCTGPSPWKTFGS